jgi:uncharacterized protein involved in exopolysaccharide biosynthesis
MTDPPRAQNGLKIATPRNGGMAAEHAGRWRVVLEANTRAKGNGRMEEETFALRDLLRTLRHHRSQILAVMALAVLAALVVSFAQPKRYTASSELLLGSAVPDVALPDPRTSSRAGPLGLDLPAESQARVVASPLIAARVARSLRLAPD